MSHIQVGEYGFALKHKKFKAHTSTEIRLPAATESR